MKRTIITAILLCSLCGGSFGVIIRSVAAPQDDLNVLGGCHFNICDYPELQPLAAEYNDLIGVRFSMLKLADIAAIFGAKLDKRPDDCVRPLFAPMFIAESGARFLDPANKRHADFHAIGGVGYLEADYQFDGVAVARCLVYLRADENFVPLKSTADYPKRLEWDKAKFDTVKKWLDDHMPKVTDLGVVEVSESSPSRVSLGGDQTCIIRAGAIDHPNVTNLRYAVFLAKETSQKREENLLLRFIHRPGQSVGFLVDGKFYRLTPKLVEHLQGSSR